VTSTPDLLTLNEDRDDDHPVERVTRWVLIGLLAAIGVVAVLNAFS
jgi:hypothetical protein